MTATLTFQPFNPERRDKFKVSGVQRIEDKISLPKVGAVGTTAPVGKIKTGYEIGYKMRMKNHAACIGKAFRELLRFNV